MLSARTVALRLRPLPLAAVLARLGERWLLVAVLVVGLLAHGVTMFRYPLYLGDEGIYLQQAWAVLRLGRLSPYTYWYDHAPAGWLLLAWWVFLLPGQFLTFGMALNSGRVLMLLIHGLSTALLWQVARRLSATLLCPLVTGLLFSLSPLALYYHRMVLLDNIMVFWLLLSLYLLLWDDNRILTLVWSGLAFGLAVLTKENAVFFLPVCLYMLHRQVRSTYRWRFALGGWLFAVVMLVSLYPLYAFLKTELWPANLQVLWNVQAGPGERVSLIHTVLWQLQRRGGGILDPHSEFWYFFWTRWWYRDPLILVVGALSAGFNLVQGWRGGPAARGRLVAALLALAFGFYLTRGSVMLEFYITPLLPFLALNSGLLAEELIGLLSPALQTPVGVAGLAFLVVLSFLNAHDAYFLDLTRLQAQQLQWIRRNIPPTARLIIDDDLWVDLHEPSGRWPIFPGAHSHWKAANDPEVASRFFQNDWRTVDYIVLSDDITPYLRQEGEDRIPWQACRNAREVARFAFGDVELLIGQVVKDGSLAGRGLCQP